MQNGNYPFFRALCLSLLLLALTPLYAHSALGEDTFFFFSDPDDDESPSEGADIVFSDGDADSAQAAEPAAEGADMPLLVNEQYPVDTSFSPSDLVMMADYCDPDIVKMKGSKIEGERVAVDALLAMLGDAVADGVKNWQVSSGYRSVQYQQEMWDNRVYRYRKEDGLSGSQARAATARYMALPGASEHHTGLAFDITVPGEESFVSTKQCAWLHEHCWDYGFIIRFTAEKQPITGINEEPWHIRYVGLPHSRNMKESGECLEEYLGKAGV